MDVLERGRLARRIYDVAHLAGTFVLRSGVTSSEYFDKYLFEGDPVLLADIAQAMEPLVAPRTEALAGLELGGVPLATALSRHTGLPTRFVRKQAKDYGTCRLAEGGEIDGVRLTVVEDVVTSGGQVIASVRALRDLGAEVARVICVIDREVGGFDNFAAAGIEAAALFRMSELRP
ncbi:MAG: orotate phosphoribosyltransferase [Actinomycetota bacterium]|nr:orotate phosphoribosyltransferase [Actinomycetota bacterium]